MDCAIKNVLKNSIAEECGILPGERLISINGSEVADIIDYEYFLPEEELVLLVEDKNGELYEAEIEKEPYEDIGIEFDGDGFNKKRVCKNRCIFCFVDQMPRGMRKTLYFKDDDWRLSFLMGNYITLTNLSDEDIARIIEKKISPLYISLHAADGGVRAKLLGTPKALGTLAIMKKFAQNGITMHTQVVLCEGINDGNVLKESIGEMAALYPAVKTLAVVPVGLTKYRENCAALAPLSKETAKEAVQIIEEYQTQMLEKYGTRFVFGADELYIKAGEALPGYGEYEDFEQIENGVGLVSKFMHEAGEALCRAEGKRAGAAKFAIVTGVDFYPYMKSIVEEVASRYGTSVQAYPVQNEFFGETVTVTGLLTGRDIIAQMKGRMDGADTLLLPSACFKENEEVTLDDIDIAAIGRALEINAEIVRADGYSLVERLLWGTENT